MAGHCQLVFSARRQQPKGAALCCDCLCNEECSTQTSLCIAATMRLACKQNKDDADNVYRRRDLARTGIVCEHVSKDIRYTVVVL